MLVKETEERTESMLPLVETEIIVTTEMKETKSEMGELEKIEFEMKSLQ